MSWMAAPLWRRWLAALMDLVVPMTFWAIGTWAIVASDPEPVALPPWNLIDQVVDYLHDRPGRSAMAGLLWVATQVAWPLLFNGRTPGKRVMSLALVTGAGEGPRRGETLAWALWRVPSLLLAGLGAWWALVDVERRTLHDRLARLWLVVEPKAAARED